MLQRRGVPGSGIPGSGLGCIVKDPVNGSLPFNGNVAKRDASFFEGYAKVNYTINDKLAVGANEYYSPNFLNPGAWGNYASITAKYTAPGTIFGSSGIGMYVSGEFGRQWLGTSDSFYGTAGRSRVAFPSRATTPGISVSASPTRCSRWTCVTPTPICRRGTATSSPATTRRASRPAIVTPTNPGGFGSNWCGAAGIVKLSADLTAMTNLK